MNGVYAAINYDNPPPPVRTTANGKVRYHLSLTQNEKCALYFSYPLMLAAVTLKNGPLCILTSDEFAKQFDEHRATSYSHIPVNQREPYHAVVSSLWQKTHDLIATAYEDLDRSNHKNILLPNYLKEYEETLKLFRASQASTIQCVVFSQMEINALSSLHRRKPDWQPN